MSDWNKLRKPINCKIRSHLSHNDLYSNADSAQTTKVLNVVKEEMFMTQQF